MGLALWKSLMDSDQVQHQLEQQLQHRPTAQSQHIPILGGEEHTTHTNSNCEEAQEGRGRANFMCQTTTDPKSQIPTDELSGFGFFFNRP